MCKNVKSQKNYRILLYTITEKQRRKVASGVNVDPTVIRGLISFQHIVDVEVRRWSNIDTTYVCPLGY